MPDMFADVVTKREMIAELEREIGMRRTVYGRRVAERKMIWQLADRQIAVMRAILKLVMDSPA
jgi:hypothetical protein